MLNALIIGSGQIAGGYDSPKTTEILTHAHAYIEHKNIKLLGFYDIDFSQASKMAEKWNSKALKTLEKVGNIDIISICTPDEFHLSTLKEALKLNPKIIFLEKPLSTDFDEAKKILKISKDIPILVNYSRRFVKEFQELTTKIQSGDFGDFISGNGYYGKGFIHNGSHMINLLNLLLGKISKIDVINEFVDFYEKDPTKSVFLTFENNKKFFMQGIDCNKFTIFELDLIFEKARIRILESGEKIEIYKVKNNEKFTGYENLVIKKIIDTELNFAMMNAVENIYQHIQSNEPLKSTAYEAFEAINYG